jgi:predicted aspartyl protease
MAMRFRRRKLGFGLIDTGASSTCIDDAIAQKMNLPVVDIVKLASASHASHDANVYPIHLDIAGLSIGIDCERAIGAALSAQGLILLIGREPASARCARVQRHDRLFLHLPVSRAAERTRWAKQP